ncbi:MAG: hypothetical protein QXQ46_11740 [Thermoplasmatales archaeon]
MYIVESWVLAVVTAYDLMREMGFRSVSICPLYQKYAFLFLFVNVPSFDLLV